MRMFDIFLGDEYFGHGFCDHDISYHYFCPECGNIWARTLVAAGRQHGTLIVRCPEHPHPMWPAATLFHEFKFYNVRWSKEALARDFLYLMELNSARVIHNNLPRESHDQYQAA